MNGGAMPAWIPTSPARPGRRRATAYVEPTGVHVDGVISVTPAVVQDLLAIAGPITLSDGTVVDGTNATKVLQHDLYWNYLSKETSMSGNGDVADALFAEGSGPRLRAVLLGSQFRYAAQVC